MKWIWIIIILLPLGYCIDKKSERDQAYRIFDSCMGQWYQAGKELGYSDFKAEDRAEVFCSKHIPWDYDGR